MTTRGRPLRFPNSTIIGTTVAKTYADDVRALAERRSLTVSELIRICLDRAITEDLTAQLSDRLRAA